jgi:hypothetical protein
VGFSRQAAKRRGLAAQKGEKAGKVLAGVYCESSSRSPSSAAKSFPAQ